VSTEQVLEWVADRYPGHPRLASWLRLIEATTVRTRHFLRPPDLVLSDEHLVEREAATRAALEELAAKTARRALAAADLEPGEVTTLVVSSAGWTLPGLDIALAGTLGLARQVRRTAAAQYGCGGGLWALTAAAEHVDYRGGTALVVVTDPQSLHSEPAAPSTDSMVWRGLLSDAVAAFVVTPQQTGSGPWLQVDPAAGIWTDLAPGTAHLVGAAPSHTLIGPGISLFSDAAMLATAPAVLPRLRTWLEATAPAGTEPVPGWVTTHTGGPRILAALEAGLSLKPDELNTARTALAESGNTAGPAMLDVLSRRLASPPPDGTSGLLVAFGPGFSTWAARVTVRS
jgi:predicted naringenin-chalcone synthase